MYQYKINRDKFVLSPWIEIVDLQQENLFDDHDLWLNCKDLPDRRFVLMNEKTDREYFINESISYFLQQFKDPISLGSVIEVLAKEANVERHAIQDTAVAFFKSLFVKGILLDPKIEDKHQEIEAGIGDLIGNYIIEDVICSKKDIWIYRAKNTDNGKHHIIKLLKQDYLGSRKEKKIQAFKQEFDIMKELDSEFICQFIAFNNEDQVYGVMEYVYGSTISSWLKMGQSIDTKIQLIHNLLEASAYLHATGVVHGDIHSHNFLVLDDLKIKVIDFGMSNHIQPEEDEIIRRGGVLHYLPPEKLNQSSFKFVKEKADFRSEVYQLAVLIYSILFDEKPFKGITWKDLSNNIRNSNPSFNSHHTTVNTEIISLLSKALSKKPENRFRSAVEFFDRWKDIISK
ncbi:MAG: protein kinase [Chitinophagales bacterium]|nr:protein kinase [Chitinophagales bacterium]